MNLLNRIDYRAIDRAALENMVMRTQSRLDELIGIRKRNPPLRLRIHVRVSPPIQSDPRDVWARMEPAGGEHVAELLAEGTLILCEGSSEEPRRSSDPVPFAMASARRATWSAPFY